MPPCCFSTTKFRASFGAVALTAIMGLAPMQGFAQTATAAPTEAAVVASVAGFRSAEFGMDEAAVRAAIAADFGKTDADITVSENSVERTKLLSVMVADLLEGGGTAQVSYIFGYKSKGLIQVGASWNAETDPTITDAMLVANGDVLTSHFLTAGYPSETVKVGTAVANGVLLFRGSDADGHTSILLLQGNFKDDGKSNNALSPTGLALLYSANPDQPDIFRIKDGNF
jgi:hypothetical protein